MPDPDDLTRGLRRLAERLEDESRPVDAATAMSRAPRRAPSRRGALIGGAAAIVFGGGLLVAALVDDDVPRPVDTTDTPAGTVDPVPSTTVTTGANGAVRYTGVPVDDLPDGGIAVVEGDQIILLSFDGQELGSAKASTPFLRQPGVEVVAIRPGVPLLELAAPDPAETPEGCEGAAGRGGLRVALCGGSEQIRERVVTVDSTGASTVLAEAAPGSQGIGHWQWALPSPDGQWVLAQWSGECESPTAFLVPTDGSEIRTASGATDLGAGRESMGAGWTPDGRAIVRFYGGICGSGIDEPGTYLVDPETGERTLLRAESDLASSTYLWRQEAYGNAREWAFTRAIRELGLGGCCGDPSHGGANATVGASWQGSDIAVYGTARVEPVFVPFNDLVIDSEPIEIAGSRATAGEADLGPFVSFTCGDTLWTIGGGGMGERTTRNAVFDLAEALLPRLYCTVGERPQATGHGTP